MWRRAARTGSERRAPFVIALLVVAFAAEGLGQADFGLQFDGLDYVALESAANPTALGVSEFTVELWFKRTGAGTGTNTGSLASVIPLITKGRLEAGSEGNNKDTNFFIGIEAASGRLVADFEEGAGAPSPGLNHPLMGNSPIAFGTWYHAAATYDGFDLKLYLNGTLDGQLTVSGAVAIPPRSDSIQRAALATALTSTGAPSGFFVGVLDEARVWNVARTEAEIQATKNQELTAGTGLLARWGLNEGAGTIATDSLGVSDGELINAPAWVDGFPLPDMTAPAAPVDPAANAGNGLVTLSWPPSPEDDLLGYNVYRGTMSPVPTTTPLNAALIPPASNPGLVDGGLTNGVPYFYVVEAVDHSGNASSASVEASATPHPLSGAGGLDFAGMGDAVSLGATLGTAAFTLELWFRQEGPGVATPTGTGVVPSTAGVTAVPLVTKGMAEAEGSNKDVNYFLGIRPSDRRLAADFEDSATGANHPVYGVTAITPNVWHHAAATYDGSQWQLFLDGVLETTLIVNQTPRSDSIQHAAIGTALQSTGLVNVGGHTQGFFNGVVDEVRIWDHARTEAEIQAAMNLEITAATGLLGRWGLDEGAGTAAGDSSGSGVTGAFVGAPFWVAGAPFDLPANQAPDEPTLVAPASGATGVAIPPTLEVSVSDADAGGLAVTFYGRVAGTPSFTEIASLAGVASGTVAATEWPGLAWSTMHEWYVTVNDGFQTTTGPIWSFTTAAEMFTLTVSRAGNGTGTVTSDVAGIDCGVDCDENYANGTAVELTAAADPGSTFTGWSGACTGTEACQVTMDMARSVTATFTIQTFVLNVSTVGSGTVTSTDGSIACGTDCDGTYDYGTVVELQAAAATGWTFTGWSGACTGTGACQVTMDMARSVTATFTMNVPVTHVLTVQRTGGGAVTSQPGGIACGEDCTETYDQTALVELFQAADPGWTFAGWSGDCAGTAGCQVVMDADRTVSATFIPAAVGLIAESRVAASTDDAEERPNGVVSTASTDLDLVYDVGVNVRVGLRFPGLLVPRGARIVSAYVQFMADESHKGATTLSVSGEAADHAAPFSTSAYDISSRTTTAANVEWRPAPWKVGQAGVAQRTPDLSAVVQEIVDRPGWTSGQALALVIAGSGKRVAESYEGSVPGAAMLHVEYEGGGNVAPMVDAGPGQTLYRPSDTATLDGAVTDDGLPSATTDVTWTLVSGPAPVLFGDDRSPSTTATFTAPGLYVLRLTASDGDRSAYDDVRVRVVDPAAPIATFQARVSRGSDDAEERTSGSVLVRSTDLDLVEDIGLLQTVGIRFGSVTVPYGAEILSATVQFESRARVSAGAIRLTLRGESSDNAGTFARPDGNLSSRATTRARVDWSPPDWVGKGIAGPDQESPDLAAIVQEIVDRPGWASGRAVVLIVTGWGERAAQSFEGKPAAAPILTITYR